MLTAAAAERARADRSEANLLVLAAHFADLHPVPEGGQRAGHGDPALRVGDGHGGDLGSERYGPLAGLGTPAVAEFAPEELAAALGVSGHAARTLIGEALELRHRLPRLWALVHTGRLQAPKARAVATETIALTPAAAGFVDRHLAHIAARNRIPGPGPLARLVHEALLRCDPEVAAGREQAALDRRGVWTQHRDSTATTTVTIIADTPDALAFEASVGQIATGLGALGDPDPLDTRRARAIGVLADPQRSLDLLTHPATGTRPDAGPGGTGHQARSGSRGSRAAGRGRGGGGALPAPRRRPRRHPGHRRDRRTLRRPDHRPDHLLARRRHPGHHPPRPPHHPPRPHHQRPQAVTSPGRTQAAAAGYTPPPLMREQVILRDPTCVFPGCTHPARTSDLDHITGYTPHPPDPDQPDHRGQTHPDNLAPLCRHHHRIKTHGRWHYTRDPDDGSYTWTTPTATTYTVDPHGTRHPQPT